MLTDFGKEVRKLRIDKNITLKSLADDLDVNSAYLSAIEQGKKKLTDKFLNRVVEALNILNTDQEVIIRKAAARSMSSIQIDLDNMRNDARETVAMFARNFNELNEEEVNEIKRVLKG